MNSLCSVRTTVGWLVFFMSLACGSGIATCFAIGPEPADVMLREMCQRGLAPSAIEICQVEFQRSVDLAPQRARWAMRWMECQAQLALRTSPDDPMWQAAIKTGEDYQSQYATDPRLPWLKWQSARIQLLRAQASLAQWLAAPADQKARELALASIRKVQGDLDSLEADVKQRLPQTETRGSAQPTQAPAKQLLELVIDSSLLRCESLLLRAAAYDRDSKDRVAASAEVIKIAKDVIERAPLDWPSRSELVVARATAGLEVSDIPQSIAQLESIAAGEGDRVPKQDGTGMQSAAPPSERARIRAAAVAIEAHCIKGNLPRAKSLLQWMQRQFPGSDAALAEVRIKLAELPAANDQAREARLQEVLQLTNTIGKQYGDYWKRRAEALLVNANVAAVSSTTSNEQLAKDLIVTEVRQLLAAGSKALAIEKLVNAISTARAAGRSEQAFEFALQAAALLKTEKQWSKAAEILIQASLADPSTSGAAAAHAQACWSVAQELREKPRDSDCQSRYEKSLFEQLELWPEDPVSLEPEQWLVTWLEKRGQFAQLVAMWQKRASLAKKPENRLRALRRWLESVLDRCPPVEADQAIEEFSLALKEFHDAHEAASLTLLAARLLSSNMNLLEAEAASNCTLGKLPPVNLEPQDAQLWRALISIAGARQDDSGLAVSSADATEFEVLSPVISQAWLRAAIATLDEKPITREAMVRSMLDVAPTWQSLATGAAAKAVSPMSCRTQMATLDPTRAPQELVQQLNQLTKLAEAAPQDGNLQLLLAGAKMKPAFNKSMEAIKIVRVVAIHGDKQSDMRLRARWLEISWLDQLKRKEDAIELAKQTMVTREIATPWLRERFKSFAGKTNP